MDNAISNKSTKNELISSKTKKKKVRRISEVMPIYSQMKKFNIKGQHEIENLLINNQKSISYNNINILKTDLPNIVNNLNPIEERKNIKVSNDKSLQEKKYPNSRNINSNYIIGNSKYYDNDKFNTTAKIRNLTYSRNKYNENDNNSNYMNLSQIVWHKSKNMGFVGSKNKKTRNNNDNLNMTKNNFLSNSNNMTSSTSKNNYEKIKFTINKKNLMNTIKKPSKIKMEKKNLKYKIPIDLINNKKKNALELSRDLHNNNRKLHIKQRDINNRSLSNINEIKKNKNIVEYENENENDDESKSFIESTLVAFNGLVSQAQQIGQILIDNKDIINANKQNDLISNKLKNSIDILNVDSKIDKINQKIKDEHKTVEDLQKINMDLNNKINLFNQNSQQYENKVKELVNIINQLKQNNNYGTNNNNHNNNDDNLLSGIVKQNLSTGESLNKYVSTSSENNNFTLERKPKRKKIKFGFVESIFMKPDKFEIINKKKPNENNSYKEENFIKNKKNKEPKLIFVNMNKSKVKDDYKNKILTNDDYEDAATQMANHLIIESLLSIQDEDNE